MEVKPQKEFPLLDRYSQIFPITDKTIFAYNDIIYTDYNLPPDIIIHEKTHLLQQKRDGLEFWVENYLTNPKYRLKQEIEAYMEQIKSINHQKSKILLIKECIQHLTSGLYGDIVSEAEAKKLLK